MFDTYTYNQEPCSNKKSKVAYADLWTLGQQEAIRRLSAKTKIESKTTARYVLVKDLSARADRIAANYARIYLEMEPHGKPERKGRFYWTGLAAFASKQVRCALDYSDTKWRYLTSPSWYAFEKTLNSLGKGNFWLFQDIFVWHWFYINYPDEFKNAVPTRNWNDYIDCFKDAFECLPWISEALPKVNYLAKTPYIVSGFALISRIEALPPKDKSMGDLQLESLMAIANHEQRKILQPLIYDDWVFQKLLAIQAVAGGHMGVPRRLAAMSTACETGDEAYDTVMTSGDLYNDNDRMAFITDIANNYHKLMKYKSTYMHECLNTIAGWASHV